MNSVYEKIQNYQDQEFKKIARTEETYIDFLKCAGQHSKYGFMEQLLIHAQMP